ncbi:UNVERIFIED_CONTAM: Dof zinc finger protein DOF3.7 [Sesamum latifolium]
MAPLLPPVVTTTDLNTVYSSGFPNLPDFKPSLNFSLDGLGSNYGSFQGVQESNGKLLFPFEDLKQVSSNTSTDAEQNRDQQQGADSTGYWSGVIGGGSW